MIMLKNVANEAAGHWNENEPYLNKNLKSAMYVSNCKALLILQIKIKQLTILIRPDILSLTTFFPTIACNRLSS